MKSKILLGIAVMSVLLVALSQPALAYTYEKKETTTAGFQFSPWIIAVIVVVAIAIIGVTRLIRSRISK